MHCYAGNMDSIHIQIQISIVLLHFTNRDKSGAVFGMRIANLSGEMR